MSASDPLLTEALRINYRLRSTFFYHKMKEYGVLAFPSQVTALYSVENLYNWDDRANWGAGEDAFDFIYNHKNLHLIQIFCHPKLLKEYSPLLAYYRNIAALSQKAVEKLVKMRVEQYEAHPDNRHSLSDTQVLTLSHLFNEHMTLIIDRSIQSFTEQELQSLLLVSTGAQIDGSWRNAIGAEAEKVVQNLLIKEAVERNLLHAVIPRSGTNIQPVTPSNVEAVLSDIRLYRGCMLNNQTSLLFSSEPDIAFIGKQGNTLGVIEVKGGTDSAGALERYGAAKKSFEKTLIPICDYL